MGKGSLQSFLQEAQKAGVTHLNTDVLWLERAPTKPGHWWMDCAESEGEPELVKVEMRDGKLWAIDTEIGTLLALDLHNGLTECRWRLDVSDQESAKPEHEWITQADNYPDGYRSAEDDPRAVRWATRMLMREFSPDWSKWHFTEGKGLFTACGQPVQLFTMDGSPQDGRLRRIDCKKCLSKMRESGINFDFG